MSTIVVVSSPLVVWALLLGGSSVAEAIAVQLLVLVAGFTASVVALVVALFVARRYSFDGYGRLKQPQGPTPTLPKGGGGKGGGR
jgi:putative ABC transport system permease protein